MRAVIQRALGASVTVAGEVIAAAHGDGLVVLVGVTTGDSPRDADYIARKVAELRILPQESSAVDAGAWVLVVSQFTLYADVRKGRRPSWSAAAPGEVAEPLVEAVVTGLRGYGLTVLTGRFGAMMEVALVNNGPMTIIVESPSA